MIKWNFHNREIRKDQCCYLCYREENTTKYVDDKGWRKLQDFIVNIQQRTTDECVLLCIIYLWWYKIRTKVIEKESKAICKPTMKIIWINNFLVINIKTIDRFTRNFLFMHIRWESFIVMSCSWCWTFWWVFFVKKQQSHHVHIYYNILLVYHYENARIFQTLCHFNC
jgi:hypothetical protein